MLSYFNTLGIGPVEFKSLLDTLNGSDFFFRSCTQVTWKVSLISTSLFVSRLLVNLGGDDLYSVRLENDFFKQFDFNALLTQQVPGSLNWNSETMSSKMVIFIACCFQLGLKIEN